MMNYQFYCAVLLLTINGICKAQSPYQPVQDDDAYQQKIINDMKQRFDADLPKLEGKLKRELATAYRKRSKGLYLKVKNGHFITNADLNQYFTEILNHILEKNPFLKDRGLRLLISRYNWPNASCHGEGTIVMNLGLISKLENESQLAFVLCHELAHDYQNHVNTSIHNYVEKVHGKATQKKLKRIAKSEYNTYKHATDLLQSITFNMRSHSRLHEEEADSLALVFMTPTRYDTKEAIKCLAILDEVDVSRRPDKIDFKKHFDSDHFQVKDRWLIPEEETGLIYDIDKKNEPLQDSLKTHPDCQKRIMAAQRFVHQPTKAIDPTNYSNYIRIADYEIIEGEYLLDQYGQALFHAFLLLEEAPEDAYLHTMVMDCLYELYHYQKVHELGKVLQIPDHRFDENYFYFLSFIHKLRLRDLAKTGYFYGIKNETSFSTNEEFRRSHLFSASLVLKPDELKKRKTAFLEDFPKSLNKKEVRALKSSLKN